MPPGKQASDLGAGSSRSGHAEGDSHRSISPEINARRLSFTGPGPLTSDGSRFTMDLEAFEDIEKELETFVLFKSTGQYEKAHEIFQDVLSAHLQVFPIVAEYADLLLCQGLYRILLEFLEIQLEYMQDVFTEVEIELLLMMKSLARIYRHGALREALSQAARTWEFLSQGAKDFPMGKLPGDTEIHIYEIYIDIVTLAFATSNRVSLEDMKCPWISSGTHDCTGVVEWYKLLSQENRLWEASRVLRSLLTILPKLPVHDAATLFDHHCFGQSTPSDLSDGSILDELAFAAVSISRAHALLALNLLRLPAKQDPVSECLWQVANAYHNAADDLMRDSQTIPQLTWPRLQVQVQRMEFRCARGVLGFPTENIPIIRLPPFELTGAIPRESRKCYLSSLAQSRVNSLSSYLSQMHDVGDLLGCLDVYNVVCSLLGAPEGPQDGEGKSTLFRTMHDSHLILCSGHNVSVSSRDREELLKIKSVVSHLSPPDGKTLEELFGNSGRTDGTDLDTFDVPVPILKDWAAERHLPLSPEAVEETAVRLLRCFQLEPQTLPGMADMQLQAVGGERIPVNSRIKKQHSPPTTGPSLDSKNDQSADPASLREQFKRDELLIPATSSAFDRFGRRRWQSSGEVTIQGQFHHAIHNLSSPLEKSVSRVSSTTTKSRQSLSTPFTSLPPEDSASYAESTQGLFSAIESNKADAVGLLLERPRHLNVEALNARGKTPLAIAVEQGNGDIVELLLQPPASANVNTPSNEGLTPLMIAARRGNEAILQILLDHGADFKAYSDSGFTALHYAVYSDDGAGVIHALAKLSRTVDVARKGSSEETPLITLVKQFADRPGWWRKFQVLLDSGANVNRPDNLGVTPLSLAIGENYIALVARLCELNASTEGITLPKRMSAAMIRELKKFPNLQNLGSHRRRRLTGFFR